MGQETAKQYPAMGKKDNKADKKTRRAAMSKLILYIAMSLDGYIADEDGNISFLDETPGPSPDLGYEKFYNSLQAIILGGKTYRQVKNDLSPD